MILLPQRRVELRCFLQVRRVSCQRFEKSLWSSFMNSLSFAASAISGLVLLGIGFIGLTGMPAQPVEQLTILLEPTGHGSAVDTIYMAAITIVGGWLVLFVWARLAAAAAMLLVLSKIMMQYGLLALALTILLCVVIAGAITLRMRQQE